MIPTGNDAHGITTKPIVISSHQKQDKTPEPIETSLVPGESNHAILFKMHGGGGGGCSRRGARRPGTSASPCEYTPRTTELCRVLVTWTELEKKRLWMDACGTTTLNSLAP